MTRTFENGMVIRPFRDGDQPLVEDFFAVMGPVSTGFFNNNDGNHKTAMKAFNEEKPLPDSEYFLAELDGKMVGYVFCWETKKSIPWMGICVRDGMKGKHIGTELMRFMIDYVHSIGCGGILLTTMPHNIPAQKLYEKSGFEYMGIATDRELLYELRFPAEGPKD